MRKHYPSDISKQQFELIKKDLESVKKVTKPRKIDLYDIFCGVLYVLKSGCQWRMLPSDFPKWQTIYSYFRKWSEAKLDEKSILEVILKKISWRSSYKQFETRKY